MMPDPLSTLIKLRRRVCDEARLALAKAIAAEAEAEARVQAVDRTIAIEAEAAADPAGSDATVEAFVAWLPGARGLLEEARRTLVDLQAETARVRAELTASRTAFESVEALDQQRREAAHLARERRAERDLEDRPSRPGSDWLRS